MNATTKPTPAERLRFALQTLATPQRHLEAVAKTAQGPALDRIQRALRSLDGAGQRIVEAMRFLDPRPRSAPRRSQAPRIAYVIDTYTRAWDDGMHQHPALSAGMLVRISEGADAREHDAFQRRLRARGLDVEWIAWRPRLRMNEHRLVPVPAEGRP